MTFPTHLQDANHNWDEDECARIWNSSYYTNNERLYSPFLDGNDGGLDVGHNDLEIGLRFDLAGSEPWVVHDNAPWGPELATLSYLGEQQNVTQVPPYDIVETCPENVDASLLPPNQAEPEWTSDPLLQTETPPTLIPSRNSDRSSIKPRYSPQFTPTSISTCVDVAIRSPTPVSQCNNPIIGYPEEPDLKIHQYVQVELKAKLIRDGCTVPKARGKTKGLRGLGQRSNVLSTDAVSFSGLFMSYTFTYTASRNRKLRLKKTRKAR